MARVKIFLVAVMTISALGEAGRIRRETDECEKINLAHKECVKTAYDDFVAAHEAGDDGRRDWVARKSCNLLNAAVGECGDLLSGCYGEEGSTAKKDHQVETILKQLERTVGGWDSSKCPVVREYLERQAGNSQDGGEEDMDWNSNEWGEEGPEDGDEDEAESEDDEDDVSYEADSDEEGEDIDDGDRDIIGENERSRNIFMKSFTMIMACLSLIA